MPLHHCIHSSFDFAQEDIVHQKNSTFSSLCPLLRLRSGGHCASKIKNSASSSLRATAFISPTSLRRTSVFNLLNCSLPTSDYQLPTIDYHFIFLPSSISCNSPSLLYKAPLLHES
jgi:hypothetical protein